MISFNYSFSEGQITCLGGIRSVKHLVVALMNPVTKRLVLQTYTEYDVIEAKEILIEILMDVLINKMNHSVPTEDMEESKGDNLGSD